jgi:hypothetical protein
MAYLLVSAEYELVRQGVVWVGSLEVTDSLLE